MLTLTRRVGEQLIIDLEDGREIVVELKELRRSQARIGISAPRTCNIRRAELERTHPEPETEPC